jgi:hypothetical protein
MTDERTAFLAGLTVSPTKNFSVRLLMSPIKIDMPYTESTTEFQWWLGITLFP